MHAAPSFLWPSKSHALAAHMRFANARARGKGHARGNRQANTAHRAPTPSRLHPPPRPPVQDVNQGAATSLVRLDKHIFVGGGTRPARPTCSSSTTAVCQPCQRRCSRKTTTEHDRESIWRHRVVVAREGVRKHVIVEWHLHGPTHEVSDFLQLRPARVCVGV